jgi:ElaB/YqjD/DUF883 family membrane-anchored ribosome-binding protein
MFYSKTPDQADSLVDQAAQSADMVIKSTQRAANGALDSLSDSVQDLRQQAAPALHNASEKASALLQSGVDSVRDTSHQIRESALRASDNTKKYIQDEPVKAILIAAATGAALMALVSLMRRSHTRS